ncbi:MAG TPA: DUF2325 domain-containing protein [Negativicutes bacterium]
MSVMLVGADHLGHIRKNLSSFGISNILHITGRNGSNHKKISIPQNTALVVVFVDYVNHNTVESIKKMAKAQGIPLVFSKRSWCSLKDKLIELGF